MGTRISASDENPRDANRNDTQSPYNSSASDCCYPWVSRLLQKLIIPAKQIRSAYLSSIRKNIHWRQNYSYFMSNDHKQCFQCKQQ